MSLTKRTPVLLAGIGVAVMLLGARGFYVRGRFGLIDALDCALLLLPAAMLLLVTSYVLHHARFVAVMPLFFAGLFIHAYPSFAVAQGLALVGAVASPALSEWKRAAGRVR